jgi:glycosyltransferase involved in cell wall biosynthesis
LLSILIPTLAENLNLVSACITEIEKHTDIPFELVVIVDGGTRDDVDPLSGELASKKYKWKLIHQQQVQYKNASVFEGLKNCKYQMVAIIEPQVRIDDDKWVGKMQSVFTRDRASVILDTVANTKSRTTNPVKRLWDHNIPEGCSFVVIRKDWGVLMKSTVCGDLYKWLSSKTAKAGYSAWFIPGISYSQVEAKDYPSWNESSVKEAMRRELQSRTIQSSSSPTTTEKDGFAASSTLDAKSSLSTSLGYEGRKSSTPPTVPSEPKAKAKALPRTSSSGNQISSGATTVEQPPTPTF